MRLLLLPVAALAAAPAFAAESWNIDRSHSAITFQADHLGYSVVHGRFREFDADVMFDPGNIEATEVTVTVQADSIDTDWPRRDEHLISEDFLNVEEHPTITFESTGVEQTGENTARLFGELTMLGETREVVWDVALNKIGPNPINQVETAGFTITGEIERALWGMDFGGAAFAVSVPVKIDVEINPAS
jgi:polyisoprenoid-binding protein YceI